MISRYERGASKPPVRSPSENRAERHFDGVLSLGPVYSFTAASGTHTLVFANTGQSAALPSMIRVADGASGAGALRDNSKRSPFRQRNAAVRRGGRHSCHSSCAWLIVAVIALFCRWPRPEVCPSRDLLRA